METFRVKNLIYRQVWSHPQGPRVRQDAPPPRPFRVGVFDASFKAGLWTFTPFEVFRSEEDARAALEPCLRVWEFEWDLAHGLRLVFEYASCNMEQTGKFTSNRALTEGVPLKSSSEGVYARYSSPPAFRIHLSPLAREAQARWHDMEDNPNRLLDGANVFLTTLENLFGTRGGRKEAARKLNAEWEVLSKLGDLSVRNDDRYSTNNNGPLHRLTEDEEAWIRKAIPILAKRVVEIESGLVGLHRIAMGNLPELNVHRSVAENRN